MLMSPIYPFLLTSSFVVPNVKAWASMTSDEQEQAMPKWNPNQYEKLVFVSRSGTLETHPSLSFNEADNTVKMERFAADSFWGDSINFRGREIRNAALINPSLEGLDHVTVDSIALRSLSSPGKSGFGIATTDSKGALSTTRHMRWDESAKELKVPSLSSFSKAGLEIRSDVDLMGNKLKNVNIEANTTLNQLVFKNGYIENTVLRNITATGLTLGAVAMESLTITSFRSSPIVGSLISVGKGGLLELSSDVRKGTDGRLLINSNIELWKSLHANGQDIFNVDSLDAKGIYLSEIRDDKTIVSDGLAVLGLDGKLKISEISIDENGYLGDMKVRGTIDFTHDVNLEGKISGARISGGKIDGVEKLSVVGETELRSGLQVSGETYIDGALTVSGSVLGSGPYVDVSDERFKRHIERIDSVDALERILRLNGVSYVLDIPPNHQLGRNKRNDRNEQMQFGFIAQDVEKVIPEVVETDELDFKGIQYSRLVPLLTEGLKQLTQEVRELKQTQQQMENSINHLIHRLNQLESNA